jgi:hypothetical protein
MFKRAKSRGVAFVNISTADQIAVSILLGGVGGEKVPCISWDSVRGPMPLNPLGVEAVARVCGQMDPTMLTDFPSASVLLEAKLPEGGICVIFNAHQLIEDVPGVSFRCVQGIMNLRDVFGSSGRTLVLLSPLPIKKIELGSDLLHLEDVLPDEIERKNIIERVISDAQESTSALKISAEDIEDAVRFTKGLSKYSVEQTVSLSLEKSHLDKGALNSRFIATINSTNGLKFEPPSFQLEDIGGLNSFKEFSLALAGGREPPDTIIRIDEIEKALAGVSGDSSGVSQEILGYFLSWMEDNSATGLIATGAPGTGKTMCSIVLGTVLDVPTITMDIGGMKDKYVGGSEANCANALRVLKAISKRTFWIATCNSDSALPPELKRRFKFGMWFFDLPTKEERETIWKIYLKKYGLVDDRPDDSGWTGAEVKACCETAWQLRKTPKEASRWIIPVAVAAKEPVEALRRSASGKYLSASFPGVYRYDAIEVVHATATTGRKFSMES